MSEEKKIYVIDDDSSMRKGVVRLLKSAGLKTASCESATQFIQYHLPDSDPDKECVVLDVRMPDMTGPELQDHLINQGHPLPIIFVTGHGEDNMREEVLTKGAVAFLRKPFDAEELFSAIDKAFSN